MKLNKIAEAEMEGLSQLWEWDRRSGTHFMDLQVGGIAYHATTSDLWVLPALEGWGWKVYAGEREIASSGEQEISTEKEAMKQAEQAIEQAIKQTRPAR